MPPRPPQLTPSLNDGDNIGTGTLRLKRLD
jgi:hypothetical protein